MNKRILVGLITIGFVFNINFSFADTCTENLSINVENISGEYISLDNNLRENIMFIKDGTFSGNISENGVIAWSFSGIWKLVDNLHVKEYTHDSLNQIPVGTKYMNEILSLGCGVLTYKPVSGKTNRYKKVGN